MGADKKKHRRSMNKVLDDFIVTINNTKIPLKDHKELSDILISYTEPLCKMFKDDSSAYSLAVFCWNISLIDENRRLKLISDFIKPLIANKPELKDDFEEIIKSMIERKASYFDDINVLFESKSGLQIINN